MNQKFLTFQKFNSKDLVAPLVHLLEENNIAYTVENTAGRFDPSSLNGNPNEEYSVKIHPENFDVANQLLIDTAKQSIQGHENHYLKKFSDTELYDILLKPDEWSRNDYVLAQIILKERGKEVNDELLSALRKQRIEDLSRPEPGQKTWIIFGYISVLLGGLLGVFIGLHLYTYKKTLPDGKRVYAYTLNDRNHGYIMFLSGIALFIFWLIVRIYTAD
jgi:hypothetical protein